MIVQVGARKDPDSLKRWRDPGVDGVILTPWNHPRAAVESMKRFADEVMPVLA